MWSLIAMGASGLLSAGGAYSSAKAQKANLKHQARMAEINAGLSRHQAEGAFIAGRGQIMQNTMQTAQMTGKQRASLAARGGDIGYGSNAELRAGSEAMREMDYNTLSANALRTAWGYRSQATDYENAALTGRANANAISPGKAVFTSLLTSAATSYLMYSRKNPKTDETKKSVAASSDSTMNWSYRDVAGLGSIRESDALGTRLSDWLW